MDPARLIDALDGFGLALPAVARAVPRPDAAWRPEDGAWSVVEIVRHLLDEEREDFRPRIERTLRDPDEPWDPIDPEGWAVERRYREADLGETLEAFTAERRASVAWLRGLRDPDWSAEHRHPRLGSMRAGDLLAAWSAHDALHLRQIAKRMHQLAMRYGFDVAYAGRW